MLYRHNRVWLSSSGWQRACAAASPAHLSALQHWAANDWPLVVRRSESVLPADSLGLGLALPPDAQTGVKTRIPLTVTLNEITQHEPALAFSAVANAVPSAWQAAYVDLIHELDAAQLKLHVYGSLALQAITGLPYLTAKSDIDVLFSPHTHVQLQQGLQILQTYSQQLPLDGEIVFPSGRAVAWKEWANAANSSHKVMAKSMTTLNLMNVDDLLFGLEQQS
ncbi:MAG: malonate decarboxylase holo-[acyl-carrier-protein] synthase [Herminiimonas sp.]|uniref:malonate decarboxylase holo-[acyl-carrier-protein] synthase n=1 Tax=Herminiimonas sp. TaxID=1926289 RepID=UPI00271600A9|nr:malonate decarboxylase holo-[acyl-carrier-protein] synthase [Herminiimonas sp.]MDO9420033.1 malonate decarboxylase holo-[acyl-carrier-protein] synthase [Herminiimonas sp.]